MQEKRVEWIDTVRAVSILVVILGHMHVGDHEKIWCYSFHMPIFFLISGVTYSLSSKRKKMSVLQYIKHRMRGLLIPYFCLNFLMLPVWYLNFKILGNSSTSVKSMILGIFCSNSTIVKGPTNATWFLCALFLTTVCFFLLERILKYDFGLITIWSLIIGACGFILAFVGKGKIHYPWHVNIIPVSLLFFYIGVAFMGNISVIMEKVEKYRYLYAGIFMIIGSAAGILNGKISMHGSIYGNSLLFMVSSIFISFSFVLFLWRFPRNMLVSFIGRNTLVIMAVHCPLLRFLEHFTLSTKRFVVEYPNLTGMILLGASALLAWVIKKYFPFIIGEKGGIKNRC